MSELELKANAMLRELTSQRDTALNRCAEMAGVIALLETQVANMKAEAEKKVKKKAKSKGDTGGTV